VAALLDGRERPYAEIFGAVPNYVADGVTRLPHGLVEGAEAWLQRSVYFGDIDTYWYAFAGDPTATFGGAGAAGAATAAAALVPPLAAVNGLATGIASSYAESAGWEGRPTVALPVELGGGIPTAEPTIVTVCADRCVALPVVDSCPCYVGTTDQRIANLSHAAWALVTDAPLAEGLIPIELHLVPPGGPPVGGPAA
jgi:hypothetical protein